MALDRRLGDMFDTSQRRYLESARVGRLATADADGRPHAVPVCFTLLTGPERDPTVVTPIDEKPKADSASPLRRVRDVRENPYVSLVVDEYTETWSELAWLQVLGRARVRAPTWESHGHAVEALRAKYAQYADHALEERPIVEISPGSVLTWGTLPEP